ncbi:hypothetical protein [Streptomyces sp. NPDC093261]|uniref:hypothetical protein n=1 Tax=Streptomyces sp. NPDC093261 TaxID=3366037 RepID=UPI00382779C7
MLWELQDPCEDCGAKAGEFCRPGCPSGYTAEDHRYTREPELPSIWDEPVPPGW